ncbi:hypothetical protein [Luteimonas mephitis]|uniref:hypothetical protein n=1 Tax=Luteimonas mephitis TaxID=83615 RepID=UPI00068797B2|nr:hypothetical protein [Luteimonas mephitis]
MTRLRPHRWQPLLRVLVLGLFALGLVLQPVLANVAEYHELAHDPSGSHAHDLRAVDGAEGIPGDEQSEDAWTLHLLLHFAHCCGATAALLQAFKPLPVARPDGRLAITKTPMPPQVRLTSPFRPPIFA